MEMSIPGVILIAVLVLLAVGFYGLMAVFNLIKVIIALQILAKGAMLALILAGTVTGQVNLAQRVNSNSKVKWRSGTTVNCRSNNINCVYRSGGSIIQ